MIAGSYVSQLVTNPVTRLVTFDNSILAVRPYLNGTALALSGVHVVAVRAVFTPVTDDSGWRGGRAGAECGHRIRTTRPDALDPGSGTDPGELRRADNRTHVADLGQSSGPLE